MGIAFSVLQGGIFLAYVVYIAMKVVLPSSFKAPRVGHTTLAVTLMTIAFVLGRPYFLDKLDKAHAYGQLSGVNLGGNCDDEHLHACQAAQLVYRASSVLFLYFLLTAAAGGAIHYFYTNFWPIRFLAVAATFGCVLFAPEPAVFGVYAEVSRVLSIVWMLFQGFLVLDFAHDLHDAIAAKADEHDATSGSSTSIFSSWWRILYLLLSASCLAAAGFGLTVLFTSHAGCTLGSTLAGITLAVGAATTVVSLLGGVGIGLLPPSVLFAHSTFLCWYAMSSHPDSTCNPWAVDDVDAALGKTVGVAISTAILVAAVFWITWHGGKVLDLFGVEEESVSLLSGAGSKYVNASAEGEDGNGGDDDDEAPKESRKSRVFFCLVMACASAFAAMSMTAWTRTDGSPESFGSLVTPLESLWLKVVSQWICLMLQMRVLWVTYRDNREATSYRSF